MYARIKSGHDDVEFLARLSVKASAMALKVAFQMDPIERIDIRGDSTFALLLEAQWRGHDMFYYTPDNLSLRDGKLIARATASRWRTAQATIIGSRIRARSISPRFDVVQLRQDPPFDMAYITTTHLLERIQPKTLVVNDPASVRNAPEKVFVLDFLDLMPPTLVTRSVDAIKAFRAKHKDIVVKPLYGNGGAAVFRIAEGDTNLNSLIELLGITFREPIMVQRYLSAGAQRRQAHHPGRRRDRRRHQPRAGAGRDALQSACGRQSRSPRRSRRATARSARGSARS